MQHLDTATLLVDINIRQVDQVDDDFVASIRDNGARVPIVAQQTPNGGQRTSTGRATRLTSWRSASAATTADLTFLDVNGYCTR